MKLKTERKYRGINNRLRYDRVIPIELLKRKRYLEVILRKR